MSNPKDDNHASLDKARGARGFARGSGFIAKRARDLASKGKQQELFGRTGGNGLESQCC